MSLINVAADVLRNRLGLIPSPAFLTYFVTYRCNSRCVFCDVWKRKNTGDEDMNIAEIGKAFSSLRKIEVLRLSGGEPFLRSDLVEIVNRLDQMLSPSIIHLTTNGFLSDKIVRDISEIKNKHKIHIKVSIDDIGEKHDRIRGVAGAYERAMKTVRELSALTSRWGCHVGVNQAIVEEKNIGAYALLRDEMRPMGVAVYPVIAHQDEGSLYGDAPQPADIDVSFKPIGKYSKTALIQFIRQVMADSREISDYKERMINNYHWKGLYNRLIEGKNVPNPKCVAVRNHIRVLPNGDVPICLYNKTVVGNLLRQDIDDIWRGERAIQARKWVARCSGCWQSCETGVSAIYTGDIVKGLRFKLDGK